MSDLKYFHMEDYPKSDLSQFAIKKGDILVAMSGATTGKIGTYKGNITAYLNQRTGKFEPKESLNNRFLYHFLQTQVSNMYKMAGGGAQPNLSSNDLKSKIVIPVPPLPVQEEIVRILDSFTELQAELQKKLQQYNYYRDKLLINLEDYEEYSISDISSYRRGSFPQPYTNPNFYGGEDAMPFVQVADIANEGFLLNRITNQTISKIAQPKSVFVPKGTVICSLQGSIGRVAITQYDAYIDRTIAIFTSIDPKVDKQYFAFQLSRIFNIAKEKARGGTIKTITKEEFSEFKIQVPSLKKQREIVDILDRFDKLTTDITAGLPAEIEARRKQYEYYRDQLLTFKQKA